MPGCLGNHDVHHHCSGLIDDRAWRLGFATDLRGYDPQPHHFCPASDSCPEFKAEGVCWNRPKPSESATGLYPLELPDLLRAHSDAPLGVDRETARLITISGGRGADWAGFWALVGNRLSETPHCSFEIDPGSYRCWFFRPISGLAERVELVRGIRFETKGIAQLNGKRGLPPASTPYTSTEYLHKFRVVWGVPLWGTKLINISTGRIQGLSKGGPALESVPDWLADLLSRKQEEAA